MDAQRFQQFLQALSDRAQADVSAYREGPFEVVVFIKNHTGSDMYIINTDTMEWIRCI